MKHFFKFATIPLLLILLFFACNKTPDIRSEDDPGLDSPDLVSFGVIGDYGYEGEVQEKVSAMIKSWSPNFIITLGDNNYSDGELETIDENIRQYYCDFIYNPDAPEELVCNGAAAQEKVNRFFPSLGNHDYDDGRCDPYLSFFTLPGNEYYYDFVRGPVHLFCIDSSTDDELECCDAEQAVWLKNKLASSTAPFKIVYFHHAPYSTSKHGNEEEMQWPFREWGADAVLAGHDHVYQRIHHKQDNDFPYFVCGVSGKPSIRDCFDEPLDEDDFDVVCFDDKHGAMKLIATVNQLKFQFYDVDNPAEPADEYIIQK